MNSRKQNYFQPSVEQLEQRDVPSATLGPIPGLATAALNSDFNSHVLSALDKAVQRQMPPAGAYAAVGNAADEVVVIIHDKTPTKSGYDLKVSVKL
jgi:hypothetical protein